MGTPGRNAVSYTHLIRRFRKIIGQRNREIIRSAIRPARMIQRCIVTVKRLFNSIFSLMKMCIRDRLYRISASRYSLSYWEITTSIKRRRSSLPPALSSESARETMTKGKKPMWWFLSMIKNIWMRWYDIIKRWHNVIPVSYTHLPLQSRIGRM